MADTLLTSKAVLVDRQPVVLYSSLEDLGALVANLPEDKRRSISATADTISASVQGFNLGVRVADRTPFSSVTFRQIDGSPVEFSLKAVFDSVDDPSNPDADCKTNFHIELAAQLGGMLKMMLGGKLQKALDGIAQMIADAASGRDVNLPAEDYLK